MKQVGRHAELEVLAGPRTNRSAGRSTWGRAASWTGSSPCGSGTARPWSRRRTSCRPARCECCPRTADTRRSRWSCPCRSSDSESQPMRRCGRAASSAELSSALSMSSVEPSTAAASAAACASASSSTPGAGSISAMIWPPGTSMLPVMAMSASTQWAGLVAVLVLVERKAPGDGGGLRGGVQAGRPVDILHRHLADLRGPLGRHAHCRGR